MYALELLVAFVQAYVFTILLCSGLSDCSTNDEQPNTCLCAGLTQWQTNFGCEVFEVLSVFNNKVPGRVTLNNMYVFDVPEFHVRALFDIKKRAYDKYVSMLCW